MQQRDLLRRRQQVAKPPQMFQPLYKRTELEEDFQRQMEVAFEEAYPGERSMNPSPSVLLISILSFSVCFLKRSCSVSGVDVDLVGPEPLLELSAGIQDLELDVTQDEVAPPSSENVEQETGRTDQDLPAAGGRALMSSH